MSVLPTVVNRQALSREEINETLEKRHLRRLHLVLYFEEYTLKVALLKRIFTRHIALFNSIGTVIRESS